MYWLYSSVLFLLILCTLPLWLWRLFTTDKYRTHLGERFGLLPANIHQDLKNHPCFWLHAVSVGELLAAVGLVKQLHDQFPHWRVVISTVTRTGRHMAQERLPFAHHLIYLPIDLPIMVQRVVKTIHPQFLVIMETELWPNLFHAAQKNHIPIFLVNGRLSERSYRHYAMAAMLMRHYLSPIHLFAMQSPEDAQRMTHLAGDSQKVIITGNIKFDQAQELPTTHDMARLRSRLGDQTNHRILIAASTHPGEEAILLTLFGQLSSLFSDLKLIIVPRHPERIKEIIPLLQPFRFRLFSATQGHWEEPILLVDGMGWLMKLYGIAHLAFVGGSFIPHGGQNPLEAAAWGIPPTFGPYTHHFQAIVAKLLQNNAAILADTPAILLEKWTFLLNHPEHWHTMGQAAQTVVRNNSGALEKTLQAITAHLSS